MTRPTDDEFDPYFRPYVALVPDGAIVDTLSKQFPETVALIARFGEEHADHRYEAMKWSVRELVGHCADTERMLSFRTLAIARNLPIELPSFDPDVANDHAPHDERPLTDIVHEWRLVREATLALARSLDPSAIGRRGIAAGKVCSTRALLWILAGHELHHRLVLEERYSSVLA